MQLRHEFKHYINYSDYLVLRQKLKMIMKADEHVCDSNEHTIRSLYFDNLYDKALREKIDGIKTREKFRIRIYNNNDDYVKLEKKSKINRLCHKQSAILSKQQANTNLH